MRMEHKLCPMFGDVEVHRVVAIEYQKQGSRMWLPFSVMTQAEDRSPCQYNFDWSKARGELYCHMCGFGGDLEFSVSGSSKAKAVHAKLWLADGVRAVANGRRLTAKGLRQIGYALIEAPLTTRVEGYKESTNPFDIASESEVEWCSCCKSYIPTESLCEHIEWCDDCGWWVNVVTSASTDGHSKCEHAKAESR